MSGRGLGHTGGTLDKLEAIPGFRVALSLDEFLTTLRDVGCCLISQTKDIAPADKKLYALRDVTATIESIPLISASVMSKKMAEGSNAVVLDVKCGSGAFMKTRDDALALARSLVAIGNANGVRTEAFITNMDAPLGAAVGNALEIAECVDDAARTRVRPTFISSWSRWARACCSWPARPRLRPRRRSACDEALRSGAALAKFEAMVRRQGGDTSVVRDPQRLPQASHRHIVAASAGGYVTRIDAELVGRASVVLGAGRERVDDRIAMAAGIILRRKPGDRVRAGEPYSNCITTTSTGIAGAVSLAESAIEIGPAAPLPSPLVVAWVHAEGETSSV